MLDVYNRAKNIRVAAFDVDGVLTDGTLYYSDSGEEIKAFNVRDGHGLRMLKDSGVAVAIITSAVPAASGATADRRTGEAAQTSSSRWRACVMPVRGARCRACDEVRGERG